jgi:tetratricopeptide (TPR) repeat protein
VRLLVKEGQLEKAIEAFEAVLTGGETTPYDYVYMGDLLAKTGRPENAIPHYEEGIAAYARLSFHRNAIALCRKILRLAPGHLEAHRQMGDLYAAEELYGDALHAYFAYLDRVPENEQSSGAYEETIRRVADLAPRRAEFAIRVSDLLTRLDRSDEAIEVLQEATQLAAHGGAPDVAAGLRAHIVAIDPSHATGEMPDAEPPLESSEDDEAGSREPQILVLSDADEYALGDEDERAAAAQADGASAPGERLIGLVAPAVARGAVSMERGPECYGEIDLATRAAADADAKEPVEAEGFSTHYPRGLELMQQGELEAARQSFAAAAWDEALRPEQARILQDAQARCLAGLGRHREAIREFLLALRRPGPQAATAELTYLLALEYEAIGEADEVRRRLREVLELRPDHGEAQARLDGLERGAA